MNLRHLSAGLMPALLLFAPALRVGAQSAAPAQPESESPGEETVVLSPFVVDANEDADSYAAKSTLAGSRIRTDIRDVGSSISVITQKFLQDTNSTSTESLLVYTPNSEVAGQGGNFLGAGDGTYLNQTVNDKPVFTTRIRGTTDADNTRDFYLTDIPWDSYNVGRVDMQRGPNSILFGVGSPAGIVNSSLNTAAFKNSYKVGNQVGSYGSTRWTIDLNQVIIPGELAVRLSGLMDNKKYRQDPTFRDDERIFGAFRWEPGFLNRGSARTSVRASYEKGEINSNMPRMTPPNDAITPWFDQLDRKLINPQTFTLEQRTPHPYIKAPAGMGAAGLIMTFSPGGAQEYAYYPTTGGGNNYLNGGPSTFDLTANTLGAAGGFPYVAIGPYKARSVSDPGIFDFFNNLIEGPNKFEFNEFEAFNVAVSQTFFNEKFGFEFAHDEQEARWGYRAFFNANSATLTIDMMSHLELGRPNPRAGAPVIIGSGQQSGGSWQVRNREVNRLTAFAEIDFNDLAGKDSILAKIFGRNTISALAVSQKNTDFRGNYQGFYPDETFAPLGTSAVGSRSLFLHAYLGDPIPNNGLLGSATVNPVAYSRSQLNLTGIKGVIAPVTDTVRIWNNTLGAPELIRAGVVNNDAGDDRSKSYSGGFRGVDITDSLAAVIQGRWLNGTLIPLVAVRSDEQEARSAGNPFNVGPIAEKNLWDQRWFVPRNADEIPNPNPQGASVRNTKVTSRTYSLVTHLPENWREKLPGRMNVSLIYNQSENINPQAGRRDVRGNQIGNPDGNTQEYGVALTGWEDRVTFKVVKYETEVRNASIGDRIGANQYMIAGGEGWGKQRAFALRDHPGGGGLTPGTGTPGPFSAAVYMGGVAPVSSGNWGAADTVYGYASNGQAVMWMPDGPLKGNYTTTGFTYTQAELDATWAKQNASVEAWFAPENQVPDDFITVWGLEGYKTEPTTNPGTLRLNGNPPGVSVTGDTLSRGYEFEILANPVKGLNVAINAAKTSATRTNLAQSYVDWIESRWTVYQGPYGDMRLWGGFGGRNQDDRADAVNGGIVRPGPNGSTIGGHGGDGETLRGKFLREVMIPYRTFRALEGADVPELRPWSFNVIADYTFQQGRMFGFNVGGSYRWQDANTTGFPVLDDGTGLLSYDVENPYKGSPQGVADGWLGYTRRVSERLRWRIQLNVRNIFANDGLIRVTVQPDGSPAGYRIPEPRTWAITNTLEF